MRYGPLTSRFMICRSLPSAFFPPSMLPPVFPQTVDSSCKESANSTPSGARLAEWCMRNGESHEGAWIKAISRAEMAAGCRRLDDRPGLGPPAHGNRDGADRIRGHG